MINGNARAHDFAKRIRSALRATGLTHGQALNLAARTLGARDWRTYQAKPQTATRAEIEPRLRAELDAMGIPDVDAIVAKLLPPDTPKTLPPLRVIQARRDPMDLLRGARRGHALHARGPLAKLSDEWTAHIHEIEQADPAGGTSQFWHHFYDHDGFDDTPIARDYNRIIGSWPSEETCFKLMEHVLDDQPLPARAARNREFREAASQHRQAVEYLVPVAPQHDGIEMLTVSVNAIDEGHVLLTWTRMAHMDVEGERRSLDMVRAWTVSTIAQPGWTLRRAAEAPVVAEMHLVAVGTEGKSDRSLAYWMEAHDGDMDDVQKALRTQFAPSKGHRGFDSWASERRRQGLPADVYVIDGFTPGADGKARTLTLAAAVSAVETGIAGSLPCTRDLIAAADTLWVTESAIVDSAGLPARIGDETAAEIVRLHGPGPYSESDMVPVVGGAGVIVASRHAGIDLATMLPDRETLVYDDRRLPAEPAPRRPEGMPNPLLGSGDAVVKVTRTANGIIDQVRLKAPHADPEEVTLLFAQALGGACRGEVEPERLVFDSMIAAGMASVTATARLAELMERTEDERIRIASPDYEGGILVSEDGVVPAFDHPAEEDIEDIEEIDPQERRRHEANEHAAVLINRVVELIEGAVRSGYHAEMGGVAIRRVMEETDGEDLDEVLELMLLNSMSVDHAPGMSDTRRRNPGRETTGPAADVRDAAGRIGQGSTLERIARVAATLGMETRHLRDASQAGPALAALERSLGIQPEGYLGTRLSAVEVEAVRRMEGMSIGT